VWWACIVRLLPDTPPLQDVCYSLLSALLLTKATHLPYPLLTALLRVASVRQANVPSRSAVHRVVRAYPIRSVQQVRTVYAVERVRTRAALHHVDAAASSKDVPSRSAIYDVVAALSADDVLGAGTFQDVAAIGAGDGAALRR
jgi:hypothetical protein